MEALWSEEWLLSNVLSSTDFGDTDVFGLTEVGGVEPELLKGGDISTALLLHDTSNDGQFLDSGFGPDFDSFNLSWLDEETSCISSLEASLSGMGAEPSSELSPLIKDQPVAVHQPAVLLTNQRPASLAAHQPPLIAPPPEPVTRPPQTAVPVTYVQPSSVDVSGLYARSGSVVMAGLDLMSGEGMVAGPDSGLDAILHLPEGAMADTNAAMLIVDALSDPASSPRSLSADDVESLLSTPPSSPDDVSVVPATPPPSRPRQLAAVDAPSSPDYLPGDDDGDFVPSSRKRKSGGGGARRAKAPRIEDKRERKKYQNRNAATKYRLKKQSEADGQKGELHQLETLNSDLKKKVESITGEISYMKSLLNEVLRKKGIRIM